MGSMKKRSSLLSVVLSLGAIALFSLAVGVTEVRAGSELILTVELDLDTFITPAGVPGPFNVEGDVDDTGAGTFQCWGWVFEDGLTTNVSQTYNIAGRGAIMTQGGPEGTPLAVVGGTGDFSNVRGEALQVFSGVGFDFTITFNLTGARGF